MGNEESQSADAYIEYFEFILDSFEKSRALIGDNRATNKAVAKKVKCSFIGCASHRFNLAVQEYLKVYSDDLNQIHHIMLKLRTLSVSAKLRNLTHLRPRIINNSTRWSATYEMLERFFQLYPHIVKLCVEAIENLMPNNRKLRSLEALLGKLRDLDSVTKHLQKEGTNLAEIRQIFNVTMEEFPEMENRLSPDAEIVHDSTFEKAVVKIQEEKAGDMTETEADKVRFLRIDDVATELPVVQRENCTLAERALKRRRLEQQETRYVDTRFLLPTSNCCERLFSEAGHILNEKRRGMLPANFENQMYLKQNREFWGLSEVMKVLQEQDAEEDKSD